MSYPGPILPPPFGTENVHDDDGQVIDSFFIETDNPPDLKPAQEPVPTPAVQIPKRTTKILTRSLTLDPTWGPTLLFPSDASRNGMGIRVISPTAVATDGIRVCSDPGEIWTAGRVLHGQTLANSAMDNHTGRVYVMACGNGTNGAASASVSVEAWAVVE